ncbi:hypothetical protein CMV30_17365 [Nibricoccus aquaticus]|uniref:NADH:ubiquinone oxidoreductase intermediate-associated protein 30 domain-containing protein n=1 Tax=Nibricoccus aquaticus TaxID=2576891 RepID=A0A290QA55_9BACT|nr:CIA30 family protein [Nibricoccus aquaticus]ATC65575.1 hypothetical protein CMV30_17365 [Nibricoccus aquaticus]
MKILSHPAAVFTLLIAALYPQLAHAASVPALLDNFDDAQHTSMSTDRVWISDTVAGGQSRVTQKSVNGILIVEGELTPPRGSPGWVNLVLPLSPDGESRDLSEYSGVRLRLKIVTGALSLQVCTPEVTNYDYHNTLVAVRSGETQEIRLPFTKLKRAWSEQTPLNLKNIISVNLLAVGLSKGPFAYEVDEVGFY